MRSVLSLWLGSVLLLGAAQAPWLHEHESRDHPQPEYHHGHHRGHHHGIAAHAHAHDHHDHVAAPAVSRGIARSIDACDPGDHARRVSFFSVSLPHHELPAADVSPAWQFVVAELASYLRAVLDVRTHGPPARYTAGPRAPPSA